MVVKKALSRSATSLLVVLFLPSVLLAEHLPITIYTTREGLPHNRIKWIHQDRQGFMWFSGPEGISRFDGSTFLNFNEKHGLPHPTVNYFFQSSNGNYWIATNGGGVCTFNPSLLKTSSKSNSSYFLQYRVGPNEISNRVNVLYEDRHNRIWAGTDQGLFRYDPAHEREGFRAVEIGLIQDHPEQLVVTSIVGDRNQSLWIGTGGSGLYRIQSNGKIDRFTVQNGFPGYPTIVWCLIEDLNGSIWAGTSDGLYQLLSAPDTNNKIVGQTYKNIDDLVFYVRALRQSPDGKIWIGTSFGLIVFDGMHFQKYTTSNGLSHDEITSITFDQEKQAWIGTSIGGVNKIAPHGFTTYVKADGLTNPYVHSFIETDIGEFFAISGNWTIHRFDGIRFNGVRPSLPPTVLSGGWWWQQNVLLSSKGEWWAATNQGLFRYPEVSTLDQLSNSRRSVVYTKKDGFASDNFQTFFEDSRGDIWISVTSSFETGLSRWEKTSETLHHYSSKDGLPYANWPTAFAEERNGSVWIGFYYGGLARYRNGRFRFFDARDGIPKGGIRRIHADSRGWLWIATEHTGALCIKNPDADRFQITSYTMDQGLSSNSVWCLTEDSDGIMFIGTSRGLDCLNVSNVSVRNFTVADGLADNFVQSAFRDRSGKLWFGTPKGISRFTPESRSKLSLPQIYISNLRIAGVTYPLSISGESRVAGLVLKPEQNDLEISSTALSFQGMERIRFRYRLIGAEENWSGWSDQKSVYLASLSPGDYRFEVQAKNAEGGISPTAAVIRFKILSPVWQRWWFLSLAATLIAFIAYALYRYRLLQFLRLERVRTQIASDLHDDIGLSLSHIAVLSEVLRKKAASGGGDLSQSLSQIARISREAVDSMSDIVWAVNPHKDRMMDLERRMHHAANEILFVRDIQFSFNTNGYKEDLSVATNIRREVFLIFKESLNNIVRHSNCSTVQIDLSINRGILQLIIVDNGKGFHPALESEGNGLTNMKKRAKNAGGAMEIKSAPGSGTRVELQVALA